MIFLERRFLPRCNFCSELLENQLTSLRVLQKENKIGFEKRLAEFKQIYGRDVHPHRFRKKVTKIEGLTSATYNNKPLRREELFQKMKEIIHFGGLKIRPCTNNCQFLPDSRSSFGCEKAFFAFSDTAVDGEIREDEIVGFGRQFSAQKPPSTYEKIDFSKCTHKFHCGKNEGSESAHPIMRLINQTDNFGLNHLTVDLTRKKPCDLFATIVRGFQTRLLASGNNSIGVTASMWVEFKGYYLFF